MWTSGLGEEFQRRFGYEIEPLADELERRPGVLYDYRLMVGETILSSFYEGFTEECHRLGAVSRVQCHGAPTDLLSAYSVADVPESETLLFPPRFSRIAASAAAAAGRPVTSCETFTCIYGFPRGSTLLTALKLWKQEDIADLKLVSDAVLANGVNQIVWHGAPYDEGNGENEFYASVHVGPDSPFASDLSRFNGYLARAAALMRWGRPATRLAIYLPNEDMMTRAGRPDLDVPGTSDWWEMRTVEPPPGTTPYNPLWVSGWQLKTARAHADGSLSVGSIHAPGLLVDVEYVDREAIRHLARLAKSGARIVLRRIPSCPGAVPCPDHQVALASLLNTPTVVRSLDALPVSPFVRGEALPDFFARESGDQSVLFFAHPAAGDLAYPVPHGSGRRTGRARSRVEISVADGWRPLELRFEACESLALHITPEGIHRIPLGDWMEPR